MKERNRLVIFTDLDGTLLDGNTYAFDAATEALDAARSHQIPVVLVSSKTRAEMSHSNSCFESQKYLGSHRIL